MRNVRNPVTARLHGTSGNSKGERFFDLLSGRPWVRIPPGAHFSIGFSPDFAQVVLADVAEQGWESLFCFDKSRDCNVHAGAVLPSHIAGRNPNAPADGKAHS